MAGGGFRRSLRQFTFGKGKSAGRNNTGQITIWHRGGGAKRSQRVIDVKRNTPAIGYVERIEYDPNRSTRIALVRWKEMDEKKFNRMEEEFDRPEMNPEPVTAAVQGGFALASLPGKDVFKDGLKVVVDGVSPGLKSVAGLVSIPVGMPSSKRHIVSKGVGSSKLTSVKDVFASAVSPGTVPLFPRIAVAGAKSPFFAFGTKEEVGGKNAFSLSEIQRWKMDSPVWEHRLKRKAAVSWTGISGHNEKPKMEQGLYAKAKNGMPGPDRAAVSYIIATHQMKVGSMVMNCEWSKPSTKEVQRSAN